MTWSVEFLDAARQSFLSLPERIRFQVARKIAALEEHPLSARKLQGYGDLYRIRSGDYRVIYRVDPKRRVVEIVRIRHRKDAYRDL